MVDDPGLDEFVGFERSLTPIYVLLNAIDRLERILQPFALAPQSGLASSSKRSLTLGFSPRAETTSTDTPRSAFRSAVSCA